MSATKIGENTTNVLLLFFTTNLPFVTSNQISTYRNLNVPLVSSVYLFTSRNARKTQIDQSTLRSFLLYMKRSDQQIFKSASWKKLFLQCLFYWYYLLWWMFFILCDNCKTLLLLKVYRYLEIFLNAMLLFFFWSQRFQRSPYFIRYPHNSSTMLIPKFQNKADYTSWFS